MGPVCPQSSCGPGAEEGACLQVLQKEGCVRLTPHCHSLNTGTYFVAQKGRFFIGLCQRPVFINYAPRQWCVWWGGPESFKPNITCKKYREVILREPGLWRSMLTLIKGTRGGPAGGRPPPGASSGFAAGTPRIPLSSPSHCSQDGCIRRRSKQSHTGAFLFLRD